MELARLEGSRKGATVAESVPKAVEQAVSPNEGPLAAISAIERRDELAAEASQVHQGESPSQIFGENIKKNWGRLTGWGQQKCTKAIRG